MRCFLVVSAPPHKKEKVPPLPPAATVFFTFVPLI
jgi:hypothetical protein